MNQTDHRFQDSLSLHSVRYVESMFRVTVLESHTIGDFKFHRIYNIAHSAGKMLNVDFAFQH